MAAATMSAGGLLFRVSNTKDSFVVRVVSEASLKSPFLGGPLIVAQKVKASNAAGRRGIQARASGAGRDLRIVAIAWKFDHWPEHSASSTLHKSSPLRVVVYPSRSISPDVERPWKSSDARLALEDGSVWVGTSFGARGTQAAELVFNTSLTG